jgi:pilus assembly protein CpaB
VSWHRRKLAVVAAVAAVITGISAARPPDPPSVGVVRATHQLAAGTTLSASDLPVDTIPRTAAPESPVTDPEQVIGTAVNSPVADGQVLTELAIGTRRASSPGMVVAPLRLSDADMAALIRLGDRVDVIAATDSGAKARVVASRVLVVGLPVAAGDGALAGGNGSGALILIEVDLPTATALNDTAAAGRLSIVLR